MAEFCLDCFNEVNGECYEPKDVYTEFDYCERCKKNSPCVIGIVKVDENE